MDTARQSLVVDCHVHVFPPDVVPEREAFCARDSWFDLLYRNPKSKLICVEDLLVAMDEAGVSRSILCGFPWADDALCRYHNEYMADAVRRFPDRLSWLGIAVPGNPMASNEAQRCFETGAVGIGELNADSQGFDWRDIRALAGLSDLCVHFDRPVLLHASEPVGHDYPGKGTAKPEKLLIFLSHFQNLKVVAAHWGGGLPFHELMPEFGHLSSHVVYDSAASTYLYRQQVFRTVLDIVGPTRVLFGSDYPVLKMDRFLRRVQSIEWRDEDEQRLVLAENALRFFRIDQTEIQE